MSALSRIKGRFEALNPPGNLSFVSMTQLDSHLYLAYVYIANSYTLLDREFKVSGEQVAVFFGYDGLKLLRLARQYREDPTDTATYNVFVELNESDKFSGSVFEIVSRSERDAEAFLKDTSHIQSILMQGLRLRSKDKYTELVESKFEHPGVIQKEIEGYLLDGGRAGLTAIAGVADTVGKFLENESKIPKEVWDEDLRPPEMNESVDKLFARIDDSIDEVLDYSLGIPDLEKILAGFVEEIPFSSSLPDIIKALVRELEMFFHNLQEFVSNTVQLIHDIAAFVKRNKPESGDSFNTLVGFLCGFWDGIVDMASGIALMIGYLLKLGKTALDVFESFGKTSQIFLEALERIYKLLRKINWNKLWEHIVSKVYPELEKYIVRQAEEFLDSIVSSPGKAGYYFGYLIYNVIETFFPPLKLAKASTAARIAEKFVRKAR